MDMSASINANAVVNYNGMDAHKKALFGHNSSDLDSGYAENFSMSHATGSTSGLSSSAKYTSMSSKRSLDLETISENNEQKDLQDTPTTRSIRLFHISTPQNDGNHSETTPQKRNYFSIHHGSSSRGSSGSKNHSKSLWQSPIPKTPRKTSFSRETKQFPSIDEDLDSVVMEKENSVCNQSIGISPIKPHNISNLMSAVIEKPSGIQRHPSGIEASTPKTFRRAQTIAKIKDNIGDILPHRLRKVKSHIPRTALRERSIDPQSSFEPDEIVFEDDERQHDHIQIPNPAKKILDFSAQRFEQLTKSNNMVLKTPTKRSQASEMKVSSASKKNPNLKRLLDTDKCRLFRKKSIKPATITPRKARKNFNESDMLAYFKDAKETDSCNAAATNAVSEENLMDISDSALTPSTNYHKSKAITSDTPIRSDFVEHSIREEANRTPTKRFDKYQSYNSFSIKSSPEKEKYNILHHDSRDDIPFCTPLKNRVHRKRSAAVGFDSPQLTEPPAKRQLYNQETANRTKNHPEIEQTTCFNGMEFTNILTQLEKKKMNHIIDKILDNLPDDALHAAYSVCKSWKKLIDENAHLSARRRKYVKKMRTNKENIHEFIKPININNNNVKPMLVHNPNQSRIEEKSITLSPSSESFNKTQQVVSSWSIEEHAVHCPTCFGISRVYQATEILKPTRRSPRRHNTSKSRYNSSASSKIQSEYAVCTQCDYEFCTNCNGNRHINAKCTRRPLGSSPKSDEDSPRRIEHQSSIKNKKRTLRRLEL